ncbi:MAG: efflux RND transporter periplasmic adaptor subunit [Chloroflexi bacterium]|nr:efflux RND transporter periplasmic adaptor subunit [Chloroflexota bacterium]
MAKKETGIKTRWIGAQTWMREHPALAIGSGAALVVVLFVLGRAILGGGTEANPNNFQIMTIERGNLTATIGATGTVRANQSATLGWGTSGVVEAVNAEVGDEIAAGEQIASLRLNSVPQNVVLAQVDYQNALNEMENFEDSFGALGVAEAEKALADAQDALEDAQRKYNYTITVAPQVDIDQAFSSMILAREKLDKARDDYDPYANKPEDNLVRANLLGRLSTAQMAYDDAVRLYNAYSSPGSPTEIAIAGAELALAQAQFDRAQREHDQVVDGPSDADRAAAEARVAAAEATLSQAYVEAPFSGTVTDAFPTVGDLVSGGEVAFQLDDTSRLLVDVEVSEVDINRVSLGQTAQLTFDAVPEYNYQGEVVGVALAGEVSDGAINFRVTVELTDADRLVLPGMTAAVNILVTELEDVLLVPNRAVRLQDGKRIVYVLDQDGQLQAVNIVLGATSETLSEVVGGDLMEGDQVVLNPPTISFDPASGPPPAFLQPNGGQR